MFSGELIMYYCVDITFELNTSFDLLRLWRGKYSISWTRRTGRKNPERNFKRYQQQIITSKED